MKAEPAANPAAETKTDDDARMGWWRDARFGMFIHWGPYSQLGGMWKGKPVPGYAEWIMRTAKIPVKDYKEVAASFNPTSYDPEKWVALAKEAGMKYIIITAKHHDGFAMFKSAHPFNIVDATPFKRDVLKELAEACQKQGMKLGFYYSQDQDWTEPGGGTGQGKKDILPIWDPAQKGDFAKYFRSKAIPQVKELLSNYPGAPVVLWFDTPSKRMTPELAKEMVEVLKEHPQIIWNNRLGGGYEGDTETPEQKIPPTGFPGRDWETCMTINKTWGFKKNDVKWKSTEKLLRNLIDIASKGGNYLLNIGPDANGVVPEPEVERLKAMGEWLKVNGEAIYGTQASPFPRKLPWGRATRKDGRLYLHVFEWPADGKLVVPMTNKVTNVRLLADKSKSIPASNTGEGVVLTLPAAAPDPIATVIEMDVDGEVKPM